MNQKGVSFSNFILEETEQARTLRRADSSSAFSDWCAPTPVDSGNYSDYYEGENNNNDKDGEDTKRKSSSTSGGAGHHYSSDRTWRMVLMGLCGGTMFSAVTSLSIIALAGRGTSFQNFLHISLSPKQTRFILIANLCSILFAATTASGVISWFTRSRLSKFASNENRTFEEENKRSEERRVGKECRS